MELLWCEYEMQPVVSTGRLQRCRGKICIVCGTSKPNQNKSYPADSQKLVSTLKLINFQQKLGGTDDQKKVINFFQFVLKACVT